MFLGISFLKDILFIYSYGKGTMFIQNKLGIQGVRDTTASDFAVFRITDSSETP
jgi:hypothetical protein